MKKIFILLLMLLQGDSMMAQQPFYKFAKSAGTYTELTGDQVLTSDFSQNSYTYALPAGFKLYGNPVSTNLVIGRDGWTTNTTLNHFFAMDPLMFTSGMLGSNGTDSKISAKTEYTATDTIVKVQWKNARMSSHQGSEYINFQLWMYKGSQTIEFHYGPSNYTPVSTDTFYATTVFFKSDFSVQYEGHSLHMNGSVLTDDTTKGSNVIYKGVPPNGTIYTFIQPPISVQEINEGSSTISVYPNPVKDMFTIKSRQGSSYTITDMNGKQLQHGLFAGKISIDISAYAAGVYLLDVNGDVTRLVKE